MIRAWFKRFREAKHLQAFYTKYERVLIPGFLLGGFVMDFLMFRTMEVHMTFAGLGVYALMAAAAILYAAIYDVKNPLAPRPLWQRLRLVAPLATQWAFGSLLSTALLFYWFGGTFAFSWPIVIFVLALAFGNEKFRHIYLRPVVQAGVFSFALFAYFSLLFPYLFNSISTGTFLLGGAASVAVCMGLVRALVTYVPSLREKRRPMIGTILGVSGLMVAFYFLNVIPPIPLAMRESGIYHDVYRSGDAYVKTGDAPTLIERVLSGGQTITRKTGGSIFAYTAIYAPSALSTTIYHRWEYFNEKRGEWVTMARPSFNIAGGRNEGYRGYTYIRSTNLGKWRVTVETERGQAVGRIPFTLVE